jgi:hypothetical protein
MGSFPVQPHEVTPEWMTEQLRASGALGDDRAVSEITTTSIGDGVGLLGLVVRMELTYGDGDGAAGPGSVVVKFAHPVAANRAIAMNTRMYEREVTFFKLIADSVDVPMPHCYAAEVDTKTGENIVVLEDMRHYAAADQVEGVDADEARLIIDAIVPLHAKFWGDTDQDVLKTAMRVDGEYIAGLSPGVEGTWERCVEQFGYCITPDVLPELGRYIAGIRELHRVMGRRTQTLVHGDVRVDNVMFGQDDQHPVVLIDWQAVMVSNPLQDVSYLLSQNLTIENRRAHEDELVRYYYDQLLAHGVTDYSLEQCWDDYDVGVLYLLSYPLIIGGAFDPANERGKQLAEEVLRRSSQTVTDRGLLARIPAPAV